MSYCNTNEIPRYSLSETIPLSEKVEVECKKFKLKKQNR